MKKALYTTMASMAVVMLQCLPVVKSSWGLGGPIRQCQQGPSCHCKAYQQHLVLVVPLLGCQQQHTLQLRTLLQTRVAEACLQHHTFQCLLSSAAELPLQVPVGIQGTMHHPSIQRPLLLRSFLWRRRVALQRRTFQ